MNKIKLVTFHISLVLFVAAVFCISCSDGKEAADKSATPIAGSDEEVVTAADAAEGAKEAEESAPKPAAVTKPTEPVEIKPLWSISSDVNPYSYEQPYAVLNGAIYFAQITKGKSNRRLVKLDTAGNALWDVDFGPGSPRVVHIGQSGTAYVEVSTSNPAIGGSYHVTAIDMNGNAENIGNSYYTNSVDVVETATAIVIFSYNYTGYDLDGKQQWVIDDAPPSGNQAVGAGEIIYSLGHNFVVAISSDGEFLWNREFEGQVAMAIDQGGDIFIAEADRLTCISGAGEQKWSHKLWTKEPAEGSQHSVLGIEMRRSIILVANRSTGEIRGFSDEGDDIWSVDTESELWFWDVDDSGNIFLLASPDRVIYIDHNGNLFWDFSFLDEYGTLANYGTPVFNGDGFFYLLERRSSNISNVQAITAGGPFEGWSIDDNGIQSIHGSLDNVVLAVSYIEENTPPYSLVAYPGPLYGSSEGRAPRKIIQDQANRSAELSYVYASSALPAHGDYRYDPLMMFDENDSTAWNEGSESDGVGEELEIHFKSSVPIDAIRFKAGFFDERYYEDNGRVKEIRISLIDESGNTVLNRTATIPDGMKPYDFEFEEAEAMRVHFTIESIHHGNKWTDLAISEISFLRNGKSVKIEIPADLPPTIGDKK